jgi:hypothetical protein
MTLPTPADEAPVPRLHAGHEEPQEPGARIRVPLTARDAVGDTCPYLLSAGGAWRSTTPSRDHRCAAVEPAVPQPTDKQRRHCLAAEHVDCALFRAARAARANNLIAGADPASVDGADRLRRPLARTAPILLEPARLVDQTVRLGLDRGPGQVALIGLMVVAFAVVALSRLSGGAAPVTPSAVPSIAAVAPSPSRTPRPTPSPRVSVSPSSSPAPSFRATYKVKKGDTMLAIARKFQTTVAAIQEANGLTNTTLKIGQVLNIP